MWSYSYEIRNIELLEGTDENAVTVLSQQDSSITSAKLLDKVEKSYSKGITHAFRFQFSVFSFFGSICMPMCVLGPNSFFNDASIFLVMS